MMVPREQEMLFAQKLCACWAVVAFILMEPLGPVKGAGCGGGQ
jgi:hypothetical protein